MNHRMKEQHCSFRRLLEALLPAGTVLPTCSAGLAPPFFLPAFLGTHSYPHDWRRAGETGPTSA